MLVLTLYVINIDTLAKDAVYGSRVRCGLQNPIHSINSGFPISSSYLEVQLGLEVHHDHPCHWCHPCLVAVQSYHRGRSWV